MTKITITDSFWNVLDHADSIEEANVKANTYRRKGIMVAFLADPNDLEVRKNAIEVSPDWFSELNNLILPF